METVELNPIPFKPDGKWIAKTFSYGVWWAAEGDTPEDAEFNLEKMIWEMDR